MAHLKNNQRGFGVYVHFPYCRKRCPYCDFSVAVSSNIPHAQYADWVIAELVRQAPLFLGRKLRSIYIGGGTPSLWQPWQLERVIDQVLKLFPIEGIFPLEITLECDPKDMSAQQLNAYYSIGISRLSLGVQSLNHKHLQMLGRLHDAKEAQAALHAVAASLFENWSVDLMIGLPEQTMSELDEDITKLTSFHPPHISVYQLTIEPKTSFALKVDKGTLFMPSDDFQREVYTHTQDVLREKQWTQYEISSYAQTGKKHFRSTHNQLYWRLGDYLGVGVSAHSFRLLPDGSGERFWNHRSLRVYQRMQTHPTQVHLNLYGEDEPLYSLSSVDEMLKDALWLGLRHLEGINKKDFTEQLGRPIESVSSAIPMLKERGFLIEQDGMIFLSQQGLLFADWVALKIVEG